MMRLVFLLAREMTRFVRRVFVVGVRVEKERVVMVFLPSELDGRRVVEMVVRRRVP